VDGGFNSKLHDDTTEFINQSASVDGYLGLLIHIPLHKPYGYCKDDPVKLETNGYVVWQNMISESRSLELVASLGPTFVFSGHDHEGCWTTYDIQRKTFTRGLMNQDHFVDRGGQVSGKLLSKNFVQHITVRSVMAEYGGFIGLFEINGDQYAYHECSFFTHQIIWTTLIVDIIAAPMLLL
jgi:hypothetical protein